MGRLAGALGPLLVLWLITGGGTPAHALELPPPLPHAFAGTVSVLEPPGPVEEGTLVEAFLDGEKAAETTVDDQSSYFLLVPGPGEQVTFKVGGIEANESAEWVSGQLQYDFDLTIDAPPLALYDLTISSTSGGSVTTPGEGTFAYDEGAVVNLVATPDEGYEFDKWTDDVGTIAGVKAASTTIITNGDYSITANFEEVAPAPVNWPLVGGVIVAVAVAGLMVFFVRRRRTP